MPPYQNEGAKV